MGSFCSTDKTKKNRHRSRSQRQARKARKYQQQQEAGSDYESGTHSESHQQCYYHQRQASPAGTTSESHSELNSSKLSSVNSSGGDWGAGGSLLGPAHGQVLGTTRISSHHQRRGSTTNSQTPSPGHRNPELPPLSPRNSVSGSVCSSPLNSSLLGRSGPDSRGVGSKGRRVAVYHSRPVAMRTQDESQWGNYYHQEHPHQLLASQGHVFAPVPREADESPDIPFGHPSRSPSTVPDTYTYHTMSPRSMLSPGGFGGGGVATIVNSPPRGGLTQAQVEGGKLALGAQAGEGGLDHLHVESPQEYGRGAGGAGGATMNGKREVIVAQKKSTQKKTLTTRPVSPSRRLFCDNEPFLSASGSGDGLGWQSAPQSTLSSFRQPLILPTSGGGGSQNAASRRGAQPTGGGTILAWMKGHHSPSPHPDAAEAVAPTRYGTPVGRRGSHIECGSQVSAARRQLRRSVSASRRGSSPNPRKPLADVEVTQEGLTSAPDSHATTKRPPPLMLPQDMKLGVDDDFSG